MTASITGGCTSTTEEFEITQPNQLTLTDIQACGTTITAQASGGSGDNYTFILINETKTKSYTFDLQPPYFSVQTSGKVDPLDNFRIKVIEYNL